MSNTRIQFGGKMPTFNELQKEMPLTQAIRDQILETRRSIENILKGVDERQLMIVGPCSIHDVDEAYEYAKLLAKWSKHQPKALVVMRVCCDKPRTKKDWRGIFNDPGLDGSHDIAKGYRISRELMIRISALGLPIACEALSPSNFHVVSDLVSYAWVGARTGSSPDVREMTSGMSMPVGIKNSNETSSLQSTIHAIDFALHPSIFAGPNNDGIMSVIKTNGNSCPHLILRGDSHGANYDEAHQVEASSMLEAHSLTTRFIVDTSHGNCNKDYTKQVDVLQYLHKHRTEGLAGIMMESYLDSGKQDSSYLGKPGAKNKVLPRLSMTDACLGWTETKKALLDFLK